MSKEPDFDKQKEESKSLQRIKEITWKIERFFGKNIIFFGIVFAFILFSLNGAINSLRESETNLRKEISEIKMSYVSITDTGVLNNLPRTFINPAEKGNEVAEALKVLLVDRATISKGFTVSSFAKTEDILDSSMELQNFLYNYILVQRGETDKIKQDQKNGYGYFQSYLSYVQELFRGVNENGQLIELPHYLKTVDKKVNKYEFKDNSFNIDVTYVTTLNIFAGKDPTTNKPIWKQKNGTSRIVARGYFDIQTQNVGINFEDKLSNTSLKGSNYSGLHFTFLQVYYGV